VVIIKTKNASLQKLSGNNSDEKCCN